MLEWLREASWLAYLCTNCDEGFLSCACMRLGSSSENSKPYLSESSAEASKSPVM